MTRRTVKIGPTGRLGARYGVKIRRRIKDIEVGLRDWHTCPKCRARSVRRLATGIWSCRHCGAKIASSAYGLAPPRAIRKEMTQIVEEQELTPEEVEELRTGRSIDEEAED